MYSLRLQTCDLLHCSFNSDKHYRNTANSVTALHQDSSYNDLLSFLQIPKISYTYGAGLLQDMPWFKRRYRI